MKYLVAVFLFVVALQTRAVIADNHHGVCIVIHGTWAQEAAWSRPGGDFFNALQESAAYNNMACVSFSWSGALDTATRHVAGESLAQLIASYPSSYKVVLVAHSHGANVGIVASHLLCIRHQHPIEAFYALAVPVHMLSYPPDMCIIKRFYNLFSFEDFVQPILGMFERTYPAHPRIANIRVVVDGKQPAHSGLHDACIGQWLLDMPDALAQKKIGGFEKFDTKQHGLLSFYKNSSPSYSFDADFEMLATQDRYLLAYLTNSLIRKDSSSLHPKYH